MRAFSTVLLAALLLAPPVLGLAGGPSGAENLPPVALFFAVPSAIKPGETVEFNATDSRDPDGRIVRYAWDFAGSGDFVAGPAVVQHAFPDPGTYAVRLRVTDDRNGTGEATQQVVVSAGGRAFNVPLILQTLPFWAQGALITIYLALAAMVLALPLAVGVGLARASRRRILRAPASVYVELLRGTPLLVQVLIAWLVLPQIGLRLAPLDAGLLALVLNTGAYVSEVVRAGVQAVPSGQLEAALSLGFTPPAAMRHVVLPQAFRIIVPPLTNEFAVLLKDTSLVSVIGVVELTQVTRIVSSQTFAVLELWLGVAAIYFALIYPVTALSRWLERRLHVPGLGASA